jgi:hypothetical protein
MEIGYTVTVKFTVDDFNTQTLYLVNEDLKDEDGIYLPAKSASIVSVEPPPLTLETCNRVIYRPYNGGDIPYNGGDIPYNGGDIPYNGGDIIGTPQYIGSTIVVFIETQTGNEISCYKSECEPYD